MFVEKNRAIVTKNLSVGICVSHSDEFYEYDILNDKKNITYVRTQNKKYDELNGEDAVEVLGPLNSIITSNGSYILSLAVSIDNRFNVLYSNLRESRILLIAPRYDTELYIKSKESICTEDSLGIKHVQVCYPTTRTSIDKIREKIHNLREILKN